MKQLARSIIRALVFRAPWGVREAVLSACIERAGAAHMGVRIHALMKVTEIGANGDCGVITSAWNDDTVLPAYALAGTFAPEVMAALTAFFRPAGGTYIDVGANIGLTTIPIARDPRVRCLAFEPEPGNFGFLQRNVARNVEGGSVQLHQLAVFERRASLSLAIADGNIGDHRVTTGGVANRRSIDIAAVPLDDFIDEVSGPLALKVDTQGAEPFVVAGGSRVFARAGLVAMEFCPYLMRQLGGDPQVVIDLVKGFDRVAVMRGDVAEAPRFLPPAEAQAILQRKVETAMPSDGDYLDILAARGP